MTDAQKIAAHEALVDALRALEKGFIDGSITFTKKRQADSDPYHPANVLMCKALALVREQDAARAALSLATGDAQESK